LRCDEDGANVEVEDVIELLDRRLFKRLGNRRAGVVDQNVERTECLHGLCNRTFDRFGIDRIGLDGDGLSAVPSIALTTAEADFASLAYVMATLAPSESQVLCDSSPDTARCTGDQCEFAFKFL
jgi:hypothetical protein